MQINKLPYGQTRIARMLGERLPRYGMAPPYQALEVGYGLPPLGL